jgi:hypothetical protein
MPELSVPVRVIFPLLRLAITQQTVAMSRSICATFSWLISCRRPVNSRASVRVLLHVQRKGDSGSPRLKGSTSASNTPGNRGSRTAKLHRPPPGRRTRSSGKGGSASSPIPLVMVTRDSPQARLTKDTPP